MLFTIDYCYFAAELYSQCNVKSSRHAYFMTYNIKAKLTNH